MPETLKNSSFALGNHDRTFIADMVENGRFGNRTEVVRAGLRLLQDYENSQKLHRLRVLITEGDADIKAGRVSEYDNADDLFRDIAQEG
jgi:antitoxin ParD1/3/4